MEAQVQYLGTAQSLELLGCSSGALSNMRFKTTALGLEWWHSVRAFDLHAADLGRT